MRKVPYDAKELKAVDTTYMATNVKVGRNVYLGKCR